jgi:hypothetical protein
MPGGDNYDGWEDEEPRSSVPESKKAKPLTRALAPPGSSVVTSPTNPSRGLKRKATASPDRSADRSKDGNGSGDARQHALSKVDIKSIKAGDFALANVDGLTYLVEILTVKPPTCRPWRTRDTSRSLEERRYHQVWWDPRVNKEAWTNSPKPHYQIFEMPIKPKDYIVITGFQLESGNRIPIATAKEYRGKVSNNKKDVMSAQAS